MFWSILYQEIVVLTVKVAVVPSFLLQEIVGIRISHIPKNFKSRLKPLRDVCDKHCTTD